MPKFRRAVALPVLLAGLTIVSACGSSSSSGAKAKSGDTKPSTTVAATSPSTAPRGGGDTSGPVQLTGSFCERVKQYSTMLSSFTRPDTTDPTAMLATVTKEIDKTNEAMPQIVASAPASIKADVQAVADAYASLGSKVNALKKYDPAEISKITSSLNSPELNEHTKKLNEYTKSKCDIDMGGDSSTSAK